MGIINAECGKTFRIAYQGENKRQQVRFDLADIMGEFPGGTAVLAVLRNGDADPVPAAETAMDGTALIWTVTAWECELEGFLYAQVTYAAGETVAKTKVYRFDVKNSLVVNGAEPEDWQDLVGQLVTAADGVNSAISAAMDTLDEKVTAAEAAQDAAEDAQEAAETARDEAVAAVGQYDDMTAEATGLAAGEEPTAVIDHTGDHPVLQLGIPKGEKGDTGATGQAGPAGPSGVDGFSPTAGVSKVGKIATITIVDKNGTTTASVSDGADGDPGDIIDDTAGAGDTNKTFSADKLTAMNSSLLNAINVLDNSKAPIIIDSASGAIATFPDGADDMPVDLVAEINPVQDLHGQSAPYPPGGGKNKANVQDVSGITTQTQIGTITLPAGDYCLSAYISNSGNASVAVRITDENNTTIRSTTYVTSAETRVYGSFTLTAETNCKIWAVGSAAGYNGTVKNVQIESGLTMTDYAPYSNICHITGWTGCNVTRTGKNLLKITDRRIITSATASNTTPRDFSEPTAYIGITMDNYFNNSKVSSYSITNNGLVVNSNNGGYGVGFTVSVFANTAYCFSYKNAEVNCIGFSFYDADGKFISYQYASSEQNFKFTTPANCVNMIVVFRPSTLNTDYVYNEPQLEFGNTKSDYASYDSETYPITWQTEAGTVYGGTVNPVTGKLIVDRVSVDLGTLNWSYDSQYQRFFTVGLTSVIKKGSSGWILPLCSAYKSAVGVSDDKTISEYATTGYVYIKDTSYTDATAFKTALSGVQLVYELATPIEHDLTDLPTIRTLIGYNAIFADTGDVAVDYRADTKLWIDGHSGSSITVDSALSSTSENPVQNKVINTALNGKEPKHNTTTVSGSTPSITAKAGVRYVCGEVSTLTIVVPSSGCIDVTFTSGSTATVLTVTPPTGMTMKWANGFDPSSLDANTTYEINIMDGCLGVAGSWT